MCRVKGEQAQAILYVVVGAIATIAVAVHWFIARKRGKVAETKQMEPHTSNDGDLAVSFQKGRRYYNSTKNRVFECIGTTGRKSRRAFFATLDRIEQERAIMLDDLKYGQTSGFQRVRTENGIETCERGAFRANRLATQQEIAAEFEFLREVRKREHS